MAYATLERPLARAPTTVSWTSENSEPPPYDPAYCDPATLMAAAYDKNPSYQRYHDDPTPQPAASSSSSAAFGATPLAPVPAPATAPWMSSPRKSTANLSIPHLREAIHTLESKMASLLSERDLLESRLEQAVRMQSPVQRVPNDLLATIFTIAVLDGEGEDEDSITLGNLMLVCRYWREVAVHSPMLWTRVMMGTHHPTDRAILKLDRSRTAPVSVFLDFSPRVEHGTVLTESIVTAMDLVRPAIWRWKAFHLIVPSRPQAHVALSRCTERAPQLEVLSVRVANSMQEDHYSRAPLPLFERNTPRLRSSSFTSFNFSWDGALLSNLRVLKLGGYWNGFTPSTDVILRTLRSCPQLEELVLRNMSDVDAPQPSMSSSSSAYSRPHVCSAAVAAADGEDHVLARVSDIQLPRLRKASLYFAGNARAATVFEHICFPALVHLELCFLEDVSPILEALWRQSLSVLPLRHLRIEACFFSELRFARLLPRLPSLASLELVDVEDATSHLMRHLAAPTASQTWVCPKLTSLSFAGCTSFEWESLRSIVESRLPPHSRAFPRQSAPSQPSPAPSGARTPTSSASASASASAAAASLMSVSSASASTHRQPASASVTATSSSASAFAASAHILARQPSVPVLSGTSLALGRPARLTCIDLARCPQISREMVQWLRMYVADVRCEPVKSVWGETSSLS